MTAGDYSGPPPGPGDYDDMLHALGRPSNPNAETHRNHYAIEPDSETARRFMALGWWDYVRTLDGGLAIYSVNGAGKAALAEWMTTKRDIEGDLYDTQAARIMEIAALDETLDDVDAANLHETIAAELRVWTSGLDDALWVLWCWHEAHLRGRAPVPDSARLHAWWPARHGTDETMRQFESDLWAIVRRHLDRIGRP